MPAQLMLGRSTCLQLFNTLLPNTSEVIVERQLSKKNNGDNWTI